MAAKRLQNVWQTSGKFPGMLATGFCAASGVLTFAAPTALAQEMAFALYEVLADHPGCTGPGHIAWETRFDVPLAEAGFIRGGDQVVSEVCTIKVRKDGLAVTQPVPCAGGGERLVSSDELMQSYCQMTASLRPSSVRLDASLTGCLTVTDNRFVGGTWTATVARPDGMRVTTGGHDDPRLEVRYTPSPGGVTGFLTPTLGIWLRLEDEVEPDLPGSVIETSGSAPYLRLVDASQPGCAEDPASCWNPDLSGEITLARDEHWPVCSNDGTNEIRSWIVRTRSEE